MVLEKLKTSGMDTEVTSAPESDRGKDDEPQTFSQLLDYTRAKWGDKVYDDYDRYLATCVTCFDKHYSSLAQYELRRID